MLSTHLGMGEGSKDKGTKATIVMVCTPQPHEKEGKAQSNFSGYKKTMKTQDYEDITHTVLRGSVVIRTCMLMYVLNKD